MTDPKNNQTPQPPAVQYATGHYPAVRDDEIDFKMLILSLWRQKFVITLTLFSFASLSIFYALSLTNYYSTEAKIRPAPIESFLGVNNTEVVKLESDEVFSSVYSALESRVLQKEFFLKRKELFEIYYQDANSDEEAYAQFLKDGFQFILPNERLDKGKGNYLTFKFVAPSGVPAEKVVDGYMGYVLNAVRERYIARYVTSKSASAAFIERTIEARSALLIENVGVKIAQLKEEQEIQLAQLGDQKQAILKELKIKRDNRIAQLKEAYSIADKMGIEQPMTLTGFSRDSKLASNSGAVITEVNSGEQPLYFMGKIALSSEIEVLTQRSDESIADSRIAEIDRLLSELKINRKVQALSARIGKDVFYDDIDTLKAELSRLQALPEDFPELELVNWVDPAYTDLKKVKPRRSLIVIAGCFLGLFFGLVVAVLRNMFTVKPSSTSVTLS